MLYDETNASSADIESSIDLRQYLALFVRWWWLVALSGILAGAAAFLISARMTPIYQASTTLMINQASSTAETDYNTILTSERLARTYAEMLVKRPVLQQVVDNLQLKNLTADDLAAMVMVTPVRDTQLITVDVQSPDPWLATTAANELFNVFAKQIESAQASRYQSSKESLQVQMTDIDRQIQQIRAQLSEVEDRLEVERLEARLTQYEQIFTNLSLSYENVRISEAQTVSNVIQVEPADVPTVPVEPQVMRNTALGTLLGLMLSLGGLFLLNALDDTLKNPAEAARALGVPVMGIIGFHPQPKTGQPLTQLEPRSPTAEAFRALRTNVQYAAVDEPLHTLMVTSPTPSDGKSTVAANLAVVMAQGGRRTTLIDADLHRPRLNQMFALGREPGLSGVFVQENAYLNGAHQPSAVENLHVLASGELPPNPAELLGSQRMREILNQVRAAADITVIDSPPVLSVTDAAVLAPQVDGVLLVVRPGETKLSALKQAVEQLRLVNANLIGLVVNGVGNGRSRYGNYYRGYYYKRVYGESKTLPVK